MRIAFPLLLLAASCGSIEVTRGDYLHMVCADPDGRFYELAIAGEPREDRRDHEHHAEEIAAAFKESGAERVLLVIHGGLVGMEEGVHTSERTLAAMQRDGTTARAFPIFVNWETGIRRSYWDYLVHVRAGERNTVLAVLTSPFMLIADVGRALVRLPLTLTQQATNLIDYYRSKAPEPVPDGWAKSARLDRTEEDDDWISVAADAGLELVPGIVRLGTGLVLDAAGLPAYKNMRRRARVLFARDVDYELARPQMSGALPALMQAIADVKPGARFTVIAHSMGALVANELVLRYGNRKFRGPDQRERPQAMAFDTIVYMGAACSMREFAGSVLPYVRDHDGTQFFNLCLHPYDEADDRYVFGTLPHGSLLDWIDDYITEQESALDRTLGKWNNAMDGLPLVDYLVDRVRKRIVTKGFPRRGPGPHDHGDFNDPTQGYWREEFWQLPSESTEQPTTQKR